MSSLVVDSWAWVEYLAGSVAGRKAEAAMSKSPELWTSIVSLAEVVSKYRRKGMDDEVAVRAITTLSKLGIPGRPDAEEAGRIHAERRTKSPNFGLADSFVLQLAKKVRGKVLTGDPDFKGLKDAQLVE